MRLTIIIDGYPHEIDSTDPELLAKWIVEIFSRIPEIYPSTMIEVKAYPSFVLQNSGQWGPDWTADSRVISQIMVIRSPRELVTALSEQLDEAEDRKSVV